MKRILIVFGDIYEFENTCDILRDDLADYGFIGFNREKNAASALRRLESEPHQLVIADLHIPRDPSQAVVEEAQSGIELLQTIQQLQIPALLVVPARTSDLQDAVDELHQCRLVEKGSRYAEQLRKYCRMFLQKCPETGQETRSPDRMPIEVEEKIGTIDLKLDLDRNSFFYEITGAYQDYGTLEIRSDRIWDLIDRSCNIQEITNWEKELRQIGKTLFEEILKNNYKFSSSYHELSGRVGDRDKIRIRFGVEKKIHPVLLEALTEDEDDTFLMLSSPVFRSLSVPGEYHLTFNGPAQTRKPVNCLIIESDVSGMAPGIDPEFNFAKLDHIATEARWLHDFLNDNREAFNIDSVEWIRSAPDGVSFVDHIRGVLERQRWELVHYAGHSYYSKNSGKGYLLFPTDTFPHPVGLKEFSKWLRDCGTQLVFLSSCHSSEEDFVFELAANKIPAIIGFRWDIDDDKALGCTRKFYSHLFQKGRTLEYAFLETRRDMHREYPGNRIWAAPMLIMQAK